MFANDLKGGGFEGYGQNPMSMKYGSSIELPISDTAIDSIRFTYGSMVRLCLNSTVYYGSLAFLQECIGGKAGSAERQKQAAIRYVTCMSTEIGVSLLFAPIRFIAAYNTPRFLLDYMFNTVSDTLSILDLFRPGLFASYAITAFTSGSDDEMNFDFFVYQVPSVVVTIVKLIMRRKRLGKEKCRTKRVLGVLFARMLLRAVIPSYSIMIPTQGGELVVASIQLFLEQLCTSYLFRHTWPYEETTPTTIPADE